MIIVWVYRPFQLCVTAIAKKYAPGETFFKSLYNYPVKRESLLMRRSFRTVKLLNLAPMVETIGFHEKAFTSYGLR